jgi:hypothetical protein
MAKVLQYTSWMGLWCGTSFQIEGVPSYIGHFDINYIFSEMLKISKNLSSRSQNTLKENIESLGLFYFMK